MEEEWGNHLAENKQLDAAINHYIEAGRTIKALDTAINAKQWKKAVQIIQVMTIVKLRLPIFEKNSIIQVIDNSNDELNKYYFKLGQHYASVKEYKMAEKFYMQGNTHKTAIEMYNTAGMWEEAHSLASQYMAAEEVSLFK